MRLGIRYAVLSFCSDLTDPRASSTPVAVMGVGSVLDADAAGPREFWFYVVRARPGDLAEVGDDEWSRDVMNNLPALLERQLSEGAQAVGADGFLPWLHDRFRNSLHAARFESVEIAVPSIQELLGELLRLYQTTVVAVGPEQPLELLSFNVNPYARVPALAH